VTDLSPQQVLFLVMSVGMILSAVLMVNARHPVYSALFMIATMFGIAGCFVMLNAYFLGVIQVLVYAGAIMVLFLFIIMLLNVDQESSYEPSLGIPGIVLSALFAGNLWATIWNEAPRLPAQFGEAAAGVAQATIRDTRLDKLAYALFDMRDGYWFAFEAVSMLLLAAIVGVVVLSKRRLE
jgi:NADH-quinone oxidoreductase subunit J